jgi:hypothetical protein
VRSIRTWIQSPDELKNQSCVIKVNVFPRNTVFIVGYAFLFQPSFVRLYKFGEMDNQGWKWLFRTTWVLRINKVLGVKVASIPSLPAPCTVYLKINVNTFIGLRIQEVQLYVIIILKTT